MKKTTIDAVGWMANDGGAISSSDHFLLIFYSTRPVRKRKGIMNKYYLVL